METPSNKIKCMFFTQYQFSHVCFEGIRNSVWNTQVDVIKGHFVNNGDRGKVLMKDTSALELKSISKITDEDAKELMKIVNLAHLSGAITSLVNSILENYGEATGKVSIWLEINDFLRSKGYAVPYLGYSVEDLVNFGWVKLV